jgi:hypothetical protein
MTEPMTVQCPKCLQQIGRRCITAYDTIARRPHAARITAAELEQAAPVEITAEDEAAADMAGMTPRSYLAWKAEQTPAPLDLERRRLELEQAADRLEQEARAASQAAYDADAEEIRIKHDYSNPHNLRDWQAAQLRSKAARDRSIAASKAAHEARYIARVAQFSDEAIDSDIRLFTGHARIHEEQNGINDSRAIAARQQIQILREEQAARMAAARAAGITAHAATIAAGGSMKQAEQAAYIAATDNGLPSCEAIRTAEEATEQAADVDAEEESEDEDDRAVSPAQEARDEAIRAARLEHDRQYAEQRQKEIDAAAALDQTPPAGFTDPDRHIHTWSDSGFVLILWSRYEPGTRLPNSIMTAYRLIDKENNPPTIVEGYDFGASPMHAWNDPQSIGALIGFLTVRPGDTDPEYFDRHTPVHLAWLKTMRSEELQSLGYDLEEGIAVEDEQQYTPAEPGSVSWGTMRDEDLIESFCSLLEELNDPRGAEYRAEYETLKAIAESGGEPAEDAQDKIGYLINETLWDAMQDHAPEGYSFTAHPGDGSDYGYWQDEGE